MPFLTFRLRIVLLASHHPVTSPFCQVIGKEQVIPVISTVLITLGAIIILLAWGLKTSLKHQHNVEDLVINSPRVCYRCLRFESGHDLIAEHEGDAHEYMPAHLVNMPETEDVRRYWPREYLR